MQKILVLISYQSENSPSSARYKQYARDDQHVTVRRLDSFYVAWDGHELQAIDRRGKLRFEDFDVVHFAGWQPQPDMAYSVANYLKQRGITFTGQTILDVYPWSKVGEMVKLVTNGVAYPKSFFACDAADLPALFAWAHEVHGLNFPVIVKGSRASKGENNYLVRSLDELTALQTEPGDEYLLQEAIPNQCDYRVLVMGYQVKTVIRRTRSNKDSHLNNTSQGAAADLLPPDAWPDGLQALAVQAAQALGRDIAGVDILIDEQTGKQYVLEVNKTPHMAIGAPNIIGNKLGALYDYLHELRQA